MAVLTLLAAEQHLDLQLCKFLPKTQRSRLQRYHLRADQLPLPLLLILTLGIPVLLDVPNGIGLVHQPVRDNLVLIEAPIGQLPAAKLQRELRSVCVHMYQSHLALNRVPRVAGMIPVCDLDSPQILRRHRHIVVDVA